MTAAILTTASKIPQLFLRLAQLDRPSGLPGAKPVWTRCACREARCRPPSDHLPGGVLTQKWRASPSPAEIQPAAAWAPNTFRSPSVHLRRRSRPHLLAEGGQAAMRRWFRSELDSGKIELRSLAQGSDGLRQAGEGGWKVSW